MLTFVNTVISKIFSSLFPPPKQHLLEMLWLNANESYTKEDNVKINGKYLMRQYNPEDKEKYFRLLEKSEMGVCPLDYWLLHILPGGFFVVEHIESGDLAGACFASHQSRQAHPFGGNLGWLAVDPDHRGNKIGVALVASVLDRLLDAGYSRIYLETHDFRLAAIKIYLNTGWLPFLYKEGMEKRWKEIYENLKIDFRPELLH